MPEFAFKDESGTVSYIFFDVDEAPSIGQSIRRKGVKLTRIPIAPATVDNTKSYVSHSQPRWAKGAKHYTKDGKPCFASKNEEREYVARANGESRTSIIMND